MSINDEYVRMILTSNLPDELKISYIKTLNFIRNYSEEQLQEIEDKIYTLNEKTLTENERMLYEINYLYSYFKDRNLDLTKLRKLYYNLKGIGKNEKEIKRIKRDITKLQLENNLKIRFYNSYMDLLDETKKQIRRKSEGTLHK